ncbi:MAG: hypothetical protein A3J48_01835 [Candidatus Doudnabacteria bacterium RIFCSPHIGHO2_02_FULL_46_11]|uniref:SH3b domain-containing protein n=1 Tax=Candidatus Doudnabacteria bacterium RIFCSPHIGHO2_02_FULL_46_11 TaxID=1817832 RepID=A0A1F5P9M0_9BACT|nr:MAG: hypothetical protein A3J48_01835 [Candidatus Doudnabacteria bacterium RIFCSPHIGHO2_02_FULL_46_11]
MAKNPPSKTKTSHKQSILSISFGTGKEKEYFIENLTMLLTSGMDILSAVETLKGEMKTSAMRRIMDELKEEIDSGSPIWQALDKTKILPAHVISLLRIGEETGRLPENLLAVGEQQQKEKSFRAKLRSAMMYPALVVVISVVVGIGISWFILPRLATVFAALDLKLPFITIALIALGNFLAEYGIYAVPVFIAFFVTVFYYIFVFPQTKFIGQRILFSLPAIRKLVLEVEIARFGYILGNLLEAGIPVTQALNSLRQATTVKFYEKFYAHLQTNVEEGNSFQKSFASYKTSARLIPLPVQQMITSGEQSGRLPKTLLKIGEIYDAKTEITIKNLSVILEPILLVIVWLGVVGIALAVILPIYSLLGGLNNQGSIDTAPPPPRQTEVIESAPPEEQLQVEDEPIEQEIPRQIEILPGAGGGVLLNVRREPSLESEVIRQVGAGQVYQADLFENGWYRILIPGFGKAWVNEEFVGVIDE